MDPTPPSIAELAVVPLRDGVMFPNAIRHFTIPISASIDLLESIAGGGDVVALVAQRDPSREDDAGLHDLYSVGTSARILNIVRLPRGEPATAVILVEGAERIQLLETSVTEPFLKVLVRPQGDVLPDSVDVEFAALKDNIRNLFSGIVVHSPFLADDLVNIMSSIEDPSALSDLVASTLPSLTIAKRQALLEAFDVRERMKMIVEELVRERENQQLQEKINTEVHGKVAVQQRDFYLREQLKAIRAELGESDEISNESSGLRAKIAEAHMPADAEKEAQRELTRLQEMPAASPEFTVSRTYLDWLVTLPWSVATARHVDLKAAARSLDDHHYDLEKVKARILEYLAVYQLRRELRGPILCFCGPPGTGKTSLGKAIAEALGRKFVRVSLGGTNDEAEIRGHRRTYVGALPGQIIQGLRRAGSNDPVFMLDEIDKLGRDFRGDPAAALMEVLDPEQNAAFRDHYLDLAFDLSRVLFITTANVLDTVPPALLDRMEVLDLPGYAEDEKLHIARTFMIPRQAREHGLESGREVAFTDDGVLEIIRGHTHEAGVRNLERAIGAICRKHARRIAEQSPSLLVVDPDAVERHLGVAKFRIETELDERTKKPGVSVALAWTPLGGDILFIEATRMPRDKGDVILTGQLGQVMQESAKAALSWLRANGLEHGIEPGDFRNFDLHLHVPAGAVPKDGPSAGVAMVAALYSLFVDRPIRRRLAMTGEITLSGQVLAVGGIKEKVLAARRSGVLEMLIPDRNVAELLEDVPASSREGIVFHRVRTIEEVLAFAFARSAPIDGPHDTAPAPQPG